MAEEDKQVASPTLDEGTPQEAKAPEQGQPPNEMESLLSELQRIGVEKPEQIQNMFTASQQTGKAWNEVGDLRRELAEAKQLIKSMNQPRQEYSEYGETPSVDLKKEMRNSLREFYMEDILKPQQEMQQRVWRESQEIQSDEDYPIVKELWEQYTRTPEFGMKLQSGQTTMKEEFGKVTRRYYRELAKRSYDTLSGLNAKSRGDIPHMESGEERSIPTPPDADEKKDKLNRINKGRTEGSLSSDKALENIIKTMLPEDDPIFRT